VRPITRRTRGGLSCRRLRPAAALPLTQRTQGGLAQRWSGLLARGGGGAASADGTPAHSPTPAALPLPGARWRIGGGTGAAAYWSHRSRAGAGSLLELLVMEGRPWARRSFLLELQSEGRPL